MTGAFFRLTRYDLVIDQLMMVLQRKNPAPTVIGAALHKTIKVDLIGIRKKSIDGDGAGKRRMVP